MTDNNSSKENKEPDSSYEEKLKKSKLPGLLGVFEEKLKNRKQTESDDSTFETINFTSASSLGINTTENSMSSEVSSSEIDGLLKKSPNRYESSFEKNDEYKKNAKVETEISKQVRYEDLNPVTEKYASYDDVKTGYNPVNKSANVSTNTNMPITNTSPIDSLNQTPYSQRQISEDEVMKHIMKHRSEKEKAKNNTENSE